MIAPALGMPASALGAERIDLAARWPDLAEELFAGFARAADPQAALAHFEAGLGSRIAQALRDTGAPGASALARHVHRRIADCFGRIAIGTLCAELGVSRRRLQQVMREQSLFSAQDQAAIARFWNVLATYLLDETQPWQAIAHDCGFVDCSHLARLLRKVLGIGPQRLRQLFAAGAFMNTGILLVPGRDPQQAVPLHGDSSTLARSILTGTPPTA